MILSRKIFAGAYNFRRKGEKMTDEEKRLAKNAQRRDYYHNWGGSDYHRHYYWEHYEEISAYQARYRAIPEHHEKMREYQRRYYAEHREEINARRRENYRLNHKKFSCSTEHGGESS